MEGYETLSILGEGTYGIVIKARHKLTGQIVAIKKFKNLDVGGEPGSVESQIHKTTLREVRVLKQMRHVNVIALLDVFRRDGKLYLVFEYIEHTILQLLECTSNGLSMKEVRTFMYQLLRGLDYCHSHRIIHRDVKPENILISKNSVVKVCDFGFARQFIHPPNLSNTVNGEVHSSSSPKGGSSSTKYTDYVATRWYRPPELLVGDTQYNEKVDIWAVGCILAEITDTQPLFPGDSDLDQLSLILSMCGDIPQYLVDIFLRNPLYRHVTFPSYERTDTLEDHFCDQPADWLELLCACLQTDPAKRPSAAELMRFPFFTKDRFRERIEAELKKAAPPQPLGVREDTEAKRSSSEAASYSIKRSSNRADEISAEKDAKTDPEMDVDDTEVGDDDDDEDEDNEGERKDDAHVTAKAENGGNTSEEEPHLSSDSSYTEGKLLAPKSERGDEDGPNAPSAKTREPYGSSSGGGSGSINSSEDFNDDDGDLGTDESDDTNPGLDEETALIQAYRFPPVNPIDSPSRRTDDGSGEEAPSAEVPLSMPSNADAVMALFRQKKKGTTNDNIKRVEMRSTSASSSISSTTPPPLVSCRPVSHGTSTPTSSTSSQISSTSSSCHSAMRAYQKIDAQRTSSDVRQEAESLPLIRATEESPPKEKIEDAPPLKATAESPAKRKKKKTKAKEQEQKRQQQEPVNTSADHANTKGGDDDVDELPVQVLPTAAKNHRYDESFNQDFGSISGDPDRRPSHVSNLKKASIDGNGLKHLSPGRLDMLLGKLNNNALPSINASGPSSRAPSLQGSLVPPPPISVAELAKYNTNHRNSSATTTNNNNNNNQAADSETNNLPLSARSNRSINRVQSDPGALRLLSTDGKGNASGSPSVNATGPIVKPEADSLNLDDLKEQEEQQRKKAKAGQDGSEGTKNAENNISEGKDDGAKGHTHKRKRSSLSDNAGISGNGKGEWDEKQGVKLPDIVPKRNNFSTDEGASKSTTTQHNKRTSISTSNSNNNSPEKSPRKNEEPKAPHSNNNTTAEGEGAPAAGKKKRKRKHSSASASTGNNNNSNNNNNNEDQSDKQHQQQKRHSSESTSKEIGPAAAKPPKRNKVPSSRPSSAGSNASSRRGRRRKDQQDLSGLLSPYRERSRPPKSDDTPNRNNNNSLAELSTDAVGETKRPVVVVVRRRKKKTKTGQKEGEGGSGKEGTAASSPTTKEEGQKPMRIPTPPANTMSSDKRYTNNTHRNNTNSRVASNPNGRKQRKRNSTTTTVEHLNDIPLPQLNNRQSTSNNNSNGIQVLGKEKKKKKKQPNTLYTLPPTGRRGRSTSKNPSNSNNPSNPNGAATANSKAVPPYAKTYTNANAPSGGGGNTNPGASGDRTNTTAPAPDREGSNPYTSGFLRSKGGTLRRANEASSAETPQKRRQRELIDAIIREHNVVAKDGEEPKAGAVNTNKVYYYRTSVPGRTSLSVGSSSNIVNPNHYQPPLLDLDKNLPVHRALN